MKNRIICNMRSGKFGRNSYFSRRPVAYLGQTDAWEFLFEDVLDAYGSNAKNLDKSASTTEIRVGVRGGSAILTVSGGAITNLTSTLTVADAYANHKLVFSFDRSPVEGYFTIGLGGSASLAVATEYPNGAAVPNLAAYSHTLFRDTTSGKIPFDASEAEIEDHVRAMIHEMVAGVGGTHFSQGVGSAGVPSTPSADFAGSWLGYALGRGLVAPTVQASIVSDTEIGVQLYVPDFALDVVRLSNTVGTHAAGVPDTPPSETVNQWGTVVVPAKGSIAITSMSVSSSGLVGPRGKTADLDFSDAAFATALGSKNEVVLWAEVDLDGVTVCDGEILLKKTMS